MGNTLDKPETEKTTERSSPVTATAVRPHGLDDSALTLTWGASCMQGWRTTMEDAYHCHTIESVRVISASNDAVSVEYELPFPHYLFSVFDGHGGTFAAEFANENLLRVLKQQDSFQRYVAMVGTPTPTPPHRNAQQEANSRSKTARRKNPGRGARDPKRATNTSTREASGIDLVLPHYLISVFDGHGGTFAAEFANENLLRVFEQQDSFQRYVALVGTATPTPAPRNAQQKANSRSKTTRRKTTGRGARDPKRTTNTNTNTNTREASGIDLVRDALETAFVDLDCELLTALRSKNVPHNRDEPVAAAHSAAHPPKDHNDGDAPPSPPPSESGTTATVVLITPDWMVCANAGDSRAVLYACNKHASSGIATMVTPLSVDQTPDLPLERERIERANGTVTSGRRALVDGRLQMSRALGDFDFKGVDVSVDTRGVARNARMAARGEGMEGHAIPGGGGTPTQSSRFVFGGGQRWNLGRVLQRGIPGGGGTPTQSSRWVFGGGSDGIWDVFSNEECGKLIDTLVCREGESDAGLIAEEVLDVALKKGSRDNMSICVVPFSALLNVVGKGGGVARRRKRRA
eukprot:CAMPEP_0194447976 /NCGR_PEP_ID=MMETSP0176-20130528/129310_1 /TAXON_ID=216777 /ORGANISM="Proboscia alata, Strain PI-D3" /LENGTH=576 /DNA_ID=CAMNT_0039274895 /DNA_START=74 /DNA_END=1806 /DNA_ORIENTATION=-